MAIREMLQAPQSLGYQSSAGRMQPAQQALNTSRAELAHLVPPGYRVRVSGAAVNLPHLPWMAILDEDVTATAQEGFYVVYLFAETLDRVYLSMNQGVTAHREHFKAAGHKRPGVAAEQELLRESQILRDTLGSDLADLEPSIKLGGAGFLGRGYEAGNVVARRYDLAALPTEPELRADLTRFLGIYRAVVEARDQLLVERPGELKTPTTARGNKRTRTQDQEPVFRPKNSSEYVATVRAHKQVRTRKHEDLVRTFGEHARTLGWTPATNVHPRDLVLRAAGRELLVEAKTVGNNAELAVREAIGQLFTYAHMLYREQGQSDPELVALFSEPIGMAFVDLLARLGIAAVWRDGGAWVGVPSP